MYECIQVQSHREQDSVLNEEGDLDNESDDSEFEIEMMKKTRHQGSSSVSSEGSVRVRYGSPMSID